MVKRTITITTILLILTIAVGFIVVLNKSSFAADDDIASGTSGTCSWVIDSEGVLTISPTNGINGKLDNYSVFTFPSWHDYKLEIKGVVVESGVKTNFWCCNLFKDLSN